MRFGYKASAEQFGAREPVERVAPYVELGFDELVFHGPGAEQRRFLELFTRDVLPRMRARWG
jgi:coenzyme F420-dependent glucose-6-phosphate dehydrogenase